MSYVIEVNHIDIDDHRFGPCSLDIEIRILIKRKVSPRDFWYIKRINTIKFIGGGY